MHKTPTVVSLRTVTSRSLSQILAVACCFVTGLFNPLFLTAQPATQRVFFNPIYEHPDPFLTYADGFYYLLNTNDSKLFTDSQTSVITVAKSSSLAGLATSEAKPVWSLGSAPFEHPYLFRYASPGSPLDVRWYLYFTVYDQDDASYVLESDSADPQGSYRFKATLCSGCWDLSILQTPDQSLYLLATDGNIFIQPLANPYTLADEQTHYIAAVDQAWESDLVEAPVPVLHFNAQNQFDQLSVVYSSNPWQGNNYGLGILKYTGTYTGNYWQDSYALLDPNNWVKVGNGPAGGGTDPSAEAYGAATFTTFSSPDGSESWFAYCAWRHDPTGNFDPDNRDVRAQKISWNEDGTPNLGSLVPLTTPLPLPSGDPGVASDHGIYPGASYRVFSQNASGTVTNPAERLCLDNLGGGSSPGAFVELYPCHGLPPQDWQVLPSTFANGYYKIMNLAAGLALDDDGASLSSPAHLQLWTDNFFDAQRWQFTEAGGGYLTVANRWPQRNGTALLLDLTEGAPASGLLAQLQTPSGSSGQNWLFAPKVRPELFYRLVNQASQLCLRADGAVSGCDDDSGILNWQLQATSDGYLRLLNSATALCLAGSSQDAPLQQGACDGQDWTQQWTLTDLFDGHYIIGNRSANAVLDGSAWTTVDLQPWGSNNAPSQKWRLILP